MTSRIRTFHDSSLGRFFAKRSLRAIIAAERYLPTLLCLWLIGLAVVVLHRLSGMNAAPTMMNLIIHGLLILSPLLGVILAARLFPRHGIMALPDFFLARVGKWRQLDLLSAHANPHFGACGAMACLAIGLLINILARTAEFLVVVPAIAAEGPGWSRTLFLTFGIDCILFNLLHAGAFILAVRNVPWFPRLLVLIWTMDLLSQFLIAHTLGGQMLPAQVSPLLGTLLVGNMQKTLISMAIWLPYLLLSKRVNVTYRWRVRS